MTVQEILDEIANFPEDVDIAKVRKSLASFTHEESTKVDLNFIVQFAALRYLTENQDGLHPNQN